MKRRAAGLVLVALASVAGCGSESASQSKPTLSKSSRLVDGRKTPYVNALEIAPDGSFLMTTNRGFWRVAKDGSKVAPFGDATVRTSEGSSPVGKFLEIYDLGNGELVGSGHPDDATTGLPQFLGLMRSNDGGKNWGVVSRLGSADLHIIRRVGTTMLAWDAVLGAVLVTRNGGRSWTERFTPKELVLDMVVDPRDERYILISTESLIYRSEDQGKRWRPFGDAPRARMAWLDSGELFRATKAGKWESSTDRGATWKRLGELPGEPWKVRAVDAQRSYVALANGSIAETQDGGRSWKLLFEAT